MDSLFFVYFSDLIFSIFKRKTAVIYIMEQTIEQIQKAKILKAYGFEPLEKAGGSKLPKGGYVSKRMGSGEGSKGGKVIGHTKSGKAIYETANHPKHKDFTVDDHNEAIAAHKVHRDAYHYSGDFSPEGKAKNDHHYEQQKEHIAAKNGLIGKQEKDQKKKQIEHHDKSHKFHTAMSEHVKQYGNAHGVNHTSEQEANRHTELAQHHKSEKERLEKQ